MNKRGSMQRAADFAEFARWHVASQDIDPAYPVLRWLTERLCESHDDVWQFVYVYVAYYDLASALQTWLDGWRPRPAVEPTPQTLLQHTDGDIMKIVALLLTAKLVISAIALAIVKFVL